MALSLGPEEKDTVATAPNLPETQLVGQYDLLFVHALLYLVKCVI